MNCFIYLFKNKLINVLNLHFKPNLIYKIKLISLKKNQIAYRLRKMPLKSSGQILNI